MKNRKLIACAHFRERWISQQQNSKTNVRELCDMRENGENEKKSTQKTTTAAAAEAESMVPKANW